jgi:hypothetical protein
MFDELNANHSTASPNVIDRSTEVLHTCLRTRTRFLAHTDISTVDRTSGRTGDERDRSPSGPRCKSVSALRPALLPYEFPLVSVLLYRCSLIREGRPRQSEVEPGLGAGCGHIGRGGPGALLRAYIGSLWLTCEIPSPNVIPTSALLIYL